MPGLRLLRGFGTLLAILGPVAWLAAAFGWFRGVRRIPILREAAKKSGSIDRYPSVSVVVPAPSGGSRRASFPAYRLSTILLASLMLFLTNVLPFFGVVLARSRAMGLLFGADVLAVAAMYAYGPRISGSKLSPLYCTPSGSLSSSTPPSGPPT